MFVKARKSVLLAGLLVVLSWGASGMPVMAAEATQMTETRLRHELTAIVWPLLSDPEIQMPGLQIGIITKNYRAHFAWGSLSHSEYIEPTPDTIYEIASFTKPFVATLLARAVLEGRIDLNAPVRDCAPAETSVLCWRGRGVTWLELATHHASLPHLPENLDWSSWQPTRIYTKAQLESFMASYKLERPPDQGFLYSSLGYGILGHELARVNGKPLVEQLEAMTAELGMPDTKVHLSHAQIMRETQGYKRTMPILRGEHQEGLAAGGGLKSSLHDMMTWLEHQLGYRQSPWSAAIARSHVVTDKTWTPVLPIGHMALGWLHYDLKRWYWHSGSMPGFKSFVAFDPEASTGVVILANAKVIGAKMEPVGMKVMERLAKLD